jgi:hypothetical protein
MKKITISKTVFVVMIALMFGVHNSKAQVVNCNACQSVSGTYAAGVGLIDPFWQQFAKRINCNMPPITSVLTNLQTATLITVYGNSEPGFNTALTALNASTLYGITTFNDLAVKFRTAVELYLNTNYNSNPSNPFKIKCIELLDVNYLLGNGYQFLLTVKYGTLASIAPTPINSNK